MDGLILVFDYFFYVGNTVSGEREWICGGIFIQCLHDSVQHWEHKTKTG